MNRAQLLEKVEKAWRDFQASYAGLTEAEMLEPGVVGEWSVKDVIAHVTIWEAEALKHLPTILAGGRTPRYADTHGGIDAFNAQTMESACRRPLAQVLQNQAQTHRRLLDYLKEVPEEAFARETRFRRRLRLDTYRHYAEHAEHIRRWRARRRK